jgi:hypothetical protein
MRLFQQVALSALLAAFVGCSDAVRESPPRTDVEVSQGLPPSVSNAVLHLVLISPTNASPTNHTEKYEMMGGNRSLDHPVGWGSNSSGRYDEDRLLAIREEGFVILFTKRDGGVVQTNAVLFRYGETTETNTLGWKIVGRFK